MKKIKLVSMILALVMIITMFAGCGSNKSADNGNGTDSGVNGGETQVKENQIDAGAMILTKMGTVPDGVHFTSGGIVTEFEKNGDEEREQVLNQNGVAFNDIWYNDVHSIISDGVCVVYNKDKQGKKLLGVVDSVREKELVPCEAVDVQLLSERFLLLCYETGLGTEDDKFGTNFNNSDHYNYKGYGKILDLEKGEIVPNIEITTSRYDVEAAGNVIFVDKDYPATEAYTADGNLIGTYEYLYVYSENEMVLQSTAEGICVYDKDMKRVSVLETDGYDDKYEPLEDSKDKLVHEYLKEDGKRYYCVTDLYGKALSAEFDTRINREFCQYISVGVGDDTKIVDYKGNVIFSDYSSVKYLEGGYFVVLEDAAGECSYVYGLNGNKINEAPLKSDFVNAYVERDTSGGLLIFETGEMMAPEDTVDDGIGSLVLIGTTLYDIVTGKTVLTDVDACVATGNNLYVWDNETEVYTRYIAEFKS